MLKNAVFGMCVVLASTLSASGHDYWLQPQQFFLSKGKTTRVHLFVGDHFVSEAERPFQLKKTVKFQLISQKEVTDLRIAAKDGKKPVATITPKHIGSHLVVMERDWSHIEIEAAKFNKYLEHEGLSKILKLRRSTGEAKTAGRERYRRYLKALIQVGDESDETYKRKIGHRLEILPLTNPSESNKSDRIAVSVLFDGKPLRGAMVAVYNRNGDDTKTQESRTDDNGQIQFLLDRPGIWLVRLVHMQRCKNVDKYDWESFWAAYSFEFK
jgi:uncharacterized GH25 family protein